MEPSVSASAGDVEMLREGTAGADNSNDPGEDAGGRLRRLLTQSQDRAAKHQQVADRYRLLSSAGPFLFGLGVVGIALYIVIDSHSGGKEGERRSEFILAIVQIVLGIVATGASNSTNYGEAVNHNRERQYEYLAVAKKASKSLDKLSKVQGFDSGGPEGSRSLLSTVASSLAHNPTGPACHAFQLLAHRCRKIQERHVLRQPKWNAVRWLTGGVWASAPLRGLDAVRDDVWA